MKNNPKRWRKYLWMGILFISLVAFSYEPLGNSDLVRYFAQLDVFKQYPFSKAWNYQQSNLYVRNILFWIVAKTGCYGFLPAIATGSVYGVAGYITCDTAERYGKENLIKVYLLLQFLLLPFFSIVNNIRNVTAFAIIVLACYRDLVQKKRNIPTLLLYLAPCFLHNGGWTLIAVRIVLILAKRFMVFALIFIFVQTALIHFAFEYRRVFAGFPAFYNLIVKANTYISQEYAKTDYAISVANSTWQQVNYYVVMSIALLLIIMILFVGGRKTIINNRLKSDQYPDNDFVILNYLICIMVLACNVFLAPHYWRYAVASNIILGNTMICLDEKKSGLLLYGKKLLWALAGLNFLLQLYHNRLYLIQLDWFERIILHGPAYIIITVIKNYIF